MNIDNLGDIAGISVGLPSGLDPEAVRRRKAALIAAGTEPLIAEKIAVDAETQQILRDAQLKPVVVKVEAPLTATVPMTVATPIPPEAAATDAAPTQADPEILVLNDTETAIKKKGGK